MSKTTKRQYYVQYLGWKEVQGVWGREFTESVTKELIKRRYDAALPKLTIEVSHKELKITQLIEKKGKTQKLKYPAIPAKDITYAVQATSPDEDIVSCIYLGFNPQTRCAVHVHVYRCASIDTADVFADHLSQITEIPEYQQRAMRIEQDLVSRAQIRPRPSAFVGSSSHLPDDRSTRDIEEEDHMSFNGRQDAYESRHYEDKHRDRYADEPYNGHVQKHKEGDVYDSLAAELRAKLKSREVKDPILYPPKDYDTIHRSAGNAYIEHRGRQEEVDSGSHRNSTEGMRVRGSWHEDSRSHGSRGSGGHDEFGDNDELRAITPRWKAPHNYVGPPPPARALSPAPDLNHDSYFPSGKDSSPLPNYLSPRSSPNMHRRMHNGDSKPRYGPKSLGLYPGRPNRDEGYSSIDRESPRGRRLRSADDGPRGQFLAPEPNYGLGRSNSDRSSPRGHDPSTSHIMRSIGSMDDDFVLY